MLIHEFHSKLVARKEESALFDALRRLRRLESPERMVANADDGSGDAATGWNIWSDASGSVQCRRAVAQAV